MTADSALPSVAIQLVIWAVTTAITGGIGFAVAWGTIRKSVRVLEQRVEQFDQGRVTERQRIDAVLAQHTADINQTEKDRLRCALHAAGEYATRGELARLIADQSTQSGENLRRIEEIGAGIDRVADALHTRITTEAKKVAALEALAAAHPQGVPK